MNNGIIIDELRVDSFSEKGLPYEFYLLASYSYSRYESNGSALTINDTVFYEKEIPDYYWRIDSTRGMFNII